MVGMTPYEFYDVFLSENYEDWKNEPDSIRKAFNVAVSAFHLADHYCLFHQRKSAAFLQRYKEKNDVGLNEFRSDLELCQPLFKVIRDMANAYKHLYTRGTTCSIDSTGAIECVEYNGESIEQDWSDASADSVAEIVIRHDDGSVTNFHTAIEGVMEMWREIIHQKDPLAIQPKTMMSK